MFIEIMRAFKLSLVWLFKVGGSHKGVFEFFRDSAYVLPGVSLLDLDIGHSLI